jgi:mRNA interferase MazF
MKRGAVYLVSQGASLPTRRWERSEAESPEPVVLRPVVLVSREAINRHSAVVLVCPLVEAASVHRLYPSDVAVEAPEGGLTTDSVALTGQLRAVARTQLVRHLGELSVELMHRVDQALRITLDLE